MTYPDSWRFVPIKKGTKAPIGREWQKHPFTYEQVPKPGAVYKHTEIGAVGVMSGSALWWPVGH